MFKHILVPTDGSPRSLHAAKTAAHLASMSGARITTFHVVPAYTGNVQGTRYPPADYVSPSDHDEQVRREADRYLGDVKAVAEAAGVECNGRYARSDFPAEAIVKAIEQYGCDTVVIGSRRSEGVSKMGSVAQKVLVDARIVVIVT